MYRVIIVIWYMHVCCPRRREAVETLKDSPKCYRMITSQSLATIGDQQSQTGLRRAFRVTGAIICKHKKGKMIFYATYRRMHSRLSSYGHPPGDSLF